MKMRHGLIAAISLASLALVSLAGCSGQTEEAPAQTTAPATQPVAQPPAPVIVAATAPAAAESDAVALSEEVVDKVEAEKAELAARAADLQTQVEDGEMIIAMKAKQIKDLEAQLKQGKTGSKK